MQNFLIGLAVLFVVATALPLVKYDAWWIRVFDFPRMQLAVAGILLIAVYLYFWDTKRVVEDVVLVLLAAAVVYQGVMMFPYTRLASKQVIASDHPDSDSELSLLIANVLMTNREKDRLLELIDTYDPGLVLTVETDEWWQEQLSVLKERYPNAVEYPLDNTYGMLLYSRYELVDPQVRFIIQDDIPSMHGQVRLPSGRLVNFHFVHPDPPNPKYAEKTTERDAELLVVGREIKAADGPTILAGDLNDVAWSHTTTLFQEIGGLLDPRRGRGMYNTFSAKNPLLRWPLDHVFHSDDFKLVDLERLPAFGSDHFPVYVRLSLEPEAERQQEEPHPDAESQEEASEKIEKAQKQ